MNSFFFCFLNNLRILKSLTFPSLYAIIVLPFNCDVLKLSTIYMLLLLFLDSKFYQIYPYILFFSLILFPLIVYSPLGLEDALSGFHLLQSETECCFHAIIFIVIWVQIFRQCMQHNSDPKTHKYLYVILISN